MTQDEARAESLQARLDRLESIEEIRMLPAKYALALDMRDLDAWTSLFPEDVAVGKDQVGRAHLRRWIDDTLRNRFTVTSHHIGGHIIEFQDADHASGVVYSKNEHETGPEWVIMQMLYWDDYERIGGRWHFRRRLPCYLYASDLNKPPIGDKKMRWPGREPYEGSWHALWPSWKAFWNGKPEEATPSVAEPVPLERFLAAMRRDSVLPKVRTR
ncbi:nuclear transport factor 2 family protein [Cupriavidus basilensis]